MQLFHDDVVLEIRVPPEVKTNPVAQFGILDRFDLRNAKDIYLRHGVNDVQLASGQELPLCTLNSSYLKVSHVTQSIFISLVDVS